MTEESTDLDRAIDELYGASLDDFVAERSRLAKQLRESGSREDADTVAKLRKPSVAAWTINQLSRRNRREVDLLLDAGHRLRQAQAGALGGGEREAFEQARSIERDALRRLSKQAEALLKERGSASSSVLNQIDETLRAASVSEAGRELLARGLFVQPLQSVGFDALSEVAPPASTGKRTAKPKRAGADEVRQAKEAVAVAKEALREAERAARAAEKEAERRRREADDADAAAERARAGVTKAERRVAEAEERLARARGDA